MYYSRLIEKEIELKLRTSGAIVVAGPKFCGKTTTCMLYQKSFIKLNTKQAIVMARMNPRQSCRARIRALSTSGRRLRPSGTR